MKRTVSVNGLVPANVSNKPAIAKNKRALGAQIEEANRLIRRLESQLEDAVMDRACLRDALDMLNGK